MPARKIITRGIFIALTLILLSAIGWMVLGGRSKLPPSKRLPDGSVVSITKVYYGKSVAIPKGKKWQRLAAHILPSAVARRWGIANTFSFGPETTFIFVETHRTNLTFSASPTAMGFTFITSVKMSDDVGNEFPLLGPYTQYFGSTTNTLIEVFRAPLVSHLATNLHLHVIQTDLSALSRAAQNSDFTVPNPAPHSQSRWPANHLPMTNQLDGLTVVLTGFKVDVFKSTYMCITNFSPTTSPQLQFFENGILSTNWHFLDLCVQDEESNRLDWGDGRYSPLETRKWRFEVQRTFPTRPEDVLTISNVPVVNDQDGSIRPVSGDFEGHTMEISRISRAQSNIKINSPFKDRKVFMTIMSGDPAWDLRANVKRLPMGSSGSTGSGFWPMPKDIKTVDVTFEFPRTTNRLVEFIARPETVKR